MMIRTKAKTFLLSVMLVMACFVFFACKEKTEVKVESITFAEQSISLLVGEEYTPTIKVLPSYATTRSYTLISSDTTALSVEGGTITALKASNVMLKVVSDDNKNVNNMIAVSIYNEASELEVPTGLIFDGNEFTFVGKDNANAYMLKINGQEINIGNNTEYTFDNVASKIDNLYNNVISCSVKAVGDGKIFKDSAYSEEILFVKLSSVKNAYVENETLHFDTIDNVASYNVEVLIDGRVTQTMVASSGSLSLSGLTDSDAGAQYTLRIIPNTNNYNGVEENNVFVGNVAQLNYNVLGKVKNVAINENVVSWDFVKNAQNYTIELYKSSTQQLIQSYSNIPYNYLQINYSDFGIEGADIEGEYYCKIIANSNNINTTTGKVYCEPLYFTVLPTPQINIANNMVVWNDVVEAEGYLVTIKDNNGATIVNKSFVLQNSYNVSNFSAGTYYIEVVACGNGENGQNADVKVFLSSNVSQQAKWTILSALQTKIEGGLLYWQDFDGYTQNKYRVTFGDYNIVLTSNEYTYNDKTQTYTYDLAQYSLEPNLYTVSITSLGKDTIFDSSVSNLNIVKLEDSSIELSNKKFIVSKVDRAYEYKVKIYKSNDLNNAIETLDNMSGYEFALDSSLLDAGNYVAKVFTYGDGRYVFDADNLSDTTMVAFEKLPTPSIEVDSENLKIIVKEVKNAEGYALFENKSSKTIVDGEYSLANLTEGDYTYTAKAIGNTSTILDSDTTLIENAKVVKKLATPTITFDKDNLTFDVTCSDKDYVKDYTFTLDDNTISVINNQANAKTYIINAGKYEAKVYANPQSASVGYNLVITSNISNYTVTKLASVCDFAISNGNLIVTPSTETAELMTESGGYSLQLCIENGANDIILNDFNYSNSQFTTTIYDDEYNVREELISLMTSAGKYDVSTIISQNKENVVTSSSVTCENQLNVLGRVTSISKNAQTIEFGVVSDATNYIAVINLEGNDYYIDIAENYTTDTNNILVMQDLVGLMEGRLNYKEQVPYTISFVATNDDSRTIANKGVKTYSFEFLKTPTISIIEQDGENTKYLAILNDEINAHKYNVVISQETDVKNETLSKQSGDNTLINMDELSQLVAGNVNIDVNAVADSGDYFESKHAILNVVKLDSSSITIANGVLEWTRINNAKQYNLVYSNITSSGTMVLTEGSENFTIQGDKCIYNFDSLDTGMSALYLQVDSEVGDGGTYYLNSNNGEVFDSVYKLSTPEISVVNGQIYTEVRYSDLRLSHKVEMYLDGKARVEITLENVDGEDKVHVRVNGIDIGNANDDSLVITPNVDNAGITLAPGVLLQYGESELLLETLSIKAYSNNETTLNSSTYSKEIYGLLSPTNLNITTSTNISEVGAINEVLEKITWNNPSANSTYVAKYEIVINYNDIDYILYSDSTKRVMMMPTYYDTNSNGKLDAGETEFGAGNYTIKVRALTDNCNNIVNSKYCNEITVTVLKTPTNLSSKNGNIIWSNDTSVGYYLIKVYLLNGDDKQLMVSSQSSLSEFDLTTLNPFETGVYGISVQAMHDNARILASKESEVFQVIRLPQVAEYYVRNGEFYIKIHSFYTKAEVYLTDKETGSTTDTFTIENQDLTKYNQFVNNSTFVDWTSSNVINTYTNDDYFVDVKYLVDDDTTLRALTSQAYSVKVKLYGNTTTKGAIISGHTSTQAINSYWKEDASVADKNVLEKLVTPTVEVSSTERGVMLINIPDGLNYSLHYYINGTNSLQGVHLYEVHISTDKTYSIYVAEIVDNDLFEASLNAVGSSLIQDDVNRNYLKHFEYNGITFNVIDSNSAGYIPFDFNTTNYYYYAKTGEYQYIDLTIGGSFVVSLRFIGDDSRFVQSNLTDTVTIKRYSVLNIDVNNGVLSWLNQATEDDNPVYVITLSNESETYNIVLYNPAIYSQEDLVGCLESGKEYIFDTITYSTDAEVQDKVITYKGLADVVAKARNANGSQAVNVGGTFLATVKAHFTDTTSMDIILAQDGDSKTIAVLPQAQINVVDGLLSWNMSYVSTTGGNEYITNYSLQIFDGNNKLYEITLKDGTYNVSSNVATYELTKILNNGSDGDFSFVPGSNYIFKLVALGGDSKTYVNSVSSETISIQLLPDLQNVRMENGVLTWTNNTTNSVEVYVSYTMGDTAITFVVTENDNTFELPTSWTDTSETLRYLVSGYDYHIKVRLKGQTNSLNGFFSDVVCMDGETVGEETIKIYPQRLKTIDSSTIVTNNGVLTWEANSDFEGVKYVVVYTLENGETYQTNMLDTNAFDFSGVATGKISVKIFAHHNNHFTSFASNTNEKAQVVDAKTIQLFKLSVPTNIKYHEGQTKISWDKVLDADGNPVDDYMVSITQEDAETQEYKCSSNEWYITGVMSDAFSIAVKAISIDESGVEINSDYTKPQTMALPYQVDATTFEYDNELKAFKWKPIQGEQIGDTYYIGFNYYDELLSVNANANMYIEREQVAVATSEAVDYYYYYPSKIGSYRLVYIQVVRAGSLSSQQTWCVDSEGAYYGLEFNLFSSGEGTSSKPYIISKGEEFRNIKYFLDAHYELSGNIEIDYLKTNEATGDIEFYPITDSTQVFTGTINGNGNEIKGLTASQQIMFDEFGYVGLFSRVQNATFANIKLTNINLNGYLNSSTLNMGLLAGHAEDSIFQTVTITSSKIQLIKNGTTGEAGYTGNNVSVYIGAITGYAQDCTFTSCKVNLGNSEQNIILNVKGNMNTQLAVGGVAGFANNCTLTGNTDDGDTSTTFIISHVLSVSTGSTTNPTLYVGALIGVVGTSGVSLTGNSCDYAEYTSSGLVSKTNQIGQEN